MIRETELQEAIASCEGERNPNANTCYKLAAYYTIQDHLFGEKKLPEYSYAPSPNTIEYESGSEFSEAIHGKPTGEVFAIIDELMDTLSVLHPRLYASVMRRLD